MARTLAARRSPKPVIQQHGEEVSRKPRQQAIDPQPLREAGHHDHFKADIEAEIDRMASRFKLGREQWFELLQDERGINAAAIRTRHRVANFGSPQIWPPAR